MSTQMQTDRETSRHTYTSRCGLIDMAFEPLSGQTKDFKIGILVASSLNASIVRLVPGLVGLVSVYCDWVGFRVVLHSISQCGSTHSIV